MTNAQRSDAASDGWDDPRIRAKRIARHACEVRDEPKPHACADWSRYASVPKAFRDLQINTNDDALKDATAKAVRLIIAQGGTVTLRGFQFRKAA